MSVPDIGDMAPDFTLPGVGPSTAPGDGGNSFSLGAHRGHPVVLYFYPKDDTSGCTVEAIDFTKAMAQFDKIGVAVAGMSPDPLGKHVKFRDKHELAVTLVSDETKDVLQAYGVWVEKSMYGRKYMGVERSTLLIDANGRIAKAWRKVKVPGHVAEVLAAARELAG